MAEKNAPKEAVPTTAADSDVGNRTQSCRTSPLVANFSICLNQDRFCPHALSFGHQYLCRHPDHAKFAVPSAKRVSGNESN